MFRYDPYDPAAFLNGQGRNWEAEQVKRSSRTLPTPPWIEWQKSPYFGTRSNHPIRAIIYHFTRGTSLSDTVRWFKNNPHKVSAHFVIGKDGRIVQMVPLDKRANHAAPGRLSGCRGINSGSIGIELVNFGPLPQGVDGKFYYTNRAYKGPKPLLADGMYWEPFREKQYRALIRLTRYLLRTFPSIRTITGHEYVDTRGKKIDPGPAFDWAKIRNSFPGFQGHLGPLPPEEKGSAIKSRSESHPQISASTLRLNRRYARTLGWGDYYGSISRLLGFKDMTPDQKTFAMGISKWQKAHGIKADGILGRNTWRTMKTVLA